MAFIDRLGGLLGPAGLSPEDQRRLGQLSLLNAGLAILSGRGPQAIGQGLLYGAQFGAGAGQQMLADARQRDAEERARQLREQLGGAGSPLPDSLRPLAALDPQTAMTVGQYVSRQNQQMLEEARQREADERASKVRAFLSDAGSPLPEPLRQLAALDPQAAMSVGQYVAQLRKLENPTTDDITEYERAKQEGFRGSFSDWILMQRRASAPSVNVNTERSLYGTIASERGKAIANLYAQAERAPDLMARAQRVKELLAPGSKAMTGFGADWKLAVAKFANQIGINTGNAASDTELLAAQLAASTLDAIKTSGLGSGTGFSNADRDFLERVVGGNFKLEAETLRRIADLNERAARLTVERWNETARRLDPSELQALGLGPIALEAQPGSGAQDDIDALMQKYGAR